MPGVFVLVRVVAGCGCRWTNFETGRVAAADALRYRKIKWRIRWAQNTSIACGLEIDGVWCWLVQGNFCCFIATQMFWHLECLPTVDRERKWQFKNRVNSHWAENGEKIKWMLILRSTTKNQQQSNFGANINAFWRYDDDANAITQKSLKNILLPVFWINMAKIIWREKVGYF